MDHKDESVDPVEVFEQIPWAKVAAPRSVSKPWIVYLVAGAIAAAVVGALVARSVTRTPQASATSVVPSTTVPMIATVPPTLPAAAPQLTEADLMAVTPGQDELAAAARAEWFVVDYFSTGGDPGAAQTVMGALPEDVSLPDSNHQTSSYVEWAATSRIEALGEQRFRSTVLFRMLVAGDGGAYHRTPVQAVDVVVEVGGNRSARVVDLPMPVEIGPAPMVAGWTDPVETLPEVVRDAALRLAGSWGASPAIVEGSEMGSGWRIVVEAGDPAGIRWPLTVWLSEQGEPILTP